ncbi:1-deoxy-D-xylulose-5-phosphate reductoisomerase [Reinekea forsetii]|nr:1-deoxy-D-xylulose-5-phosphate reductoisomerase [Reinekea forsetii]
MNANPINITVLGATGSIGCSTLDVIKRHPDKFRVFALSGFQNISLLAEQIIEFQPAVAVVPNNQTRDALKALIPNSKTEISVGEQGLIEAASASEVDAVMAAIVGFAGLSSSLAAAKAGKKLLLANKESLVVAGALLMDAVRDNDAQLLPIDSEHNAIFQCLPPLGGDAGVESILLTASGGPFRNFSLEQLAGVTPEQAVAHPNWSMGQKISVDSASLMNKGLELIEACWLFNVPPSKVEVVVHPQSVIHSMVRYVDGSVISQMGAPDMRTPIAYGLAYPERISSGSPALAFDQMLNLTFDQPDRTRFPCLRLAEEAMDVGGIQPAVLNAANEVSVAAFLDGHIGFMDIAQINEQVFNEIKTEAVESLDQLMSVDQRARAAALRLVNKVNK